MEGFKPLQLGGLRLLLLRWKGNIMERKFELYDQQNNYYYGKIKDDGNLELYDRNNNDYYYGKLKSDGKFEFYDRNNQYFYGKVKAGDKLEVYTPSGEYWHGKIKS